MTVLYRSRIGDIGPEVPDLLEGGVLIFFRAGVPAELAEVSVLHTPEIELPTPPGIGATVRIGAQRLAITAIGDKAWEKTIELGHLTLSLNGAATAERPGEICVAGASPADLAAALASGATLEVIAAG
ncbi:MAG TPA: PTS glucitol/sorbitol transporter subunit IIA [Acidiphilium sp.]|jgi:PTS system glucitol/sorbitol-specific IIA component|uniref:PTS glucitol/sorbitol transporter subunit IIA n=1 Tax=unclassified Acidiphilium TaxID=2617493 RepID=UPI000BCB5B4A|nr:MULTISPECIES: PTS glucitol/sorbitol transporter subunit IIA [unclassified Acidiphilium]OYV55050.1 MAG: hypothetical protein B7Z76_12035 [Acidiphilium sp. 20-67-58]HQT61838.1 PTS glucitol/sorbitol transporter subunit IIA [Acidiphilium sp.]HQU11419.1 PTS glucitol/sorbitol transporter subunit IIA [Acidiphilium sp.]